MKITHVTTTVVNAELRNWVFVKVTTDVPGLHGWGEATLEWQTRAVVGAVADIEPLLVGENPLRIEHLWQTMRRAHFFQGGVVTASAVSGVDQALYDLKAKHLGVPAYELLGGAVRDRLRMYDHLGGGSYDVTYGATGAFHDAARRSVEEGFTALKALPVPVGPALIGRSQLNAAASAMASIRDAVGDDVDIMVDLHGRTTMSGAIAYADALREYRPWFFEEAVQPRNPTQFARLADRIGIPLATGERLIEQEEFRDLLQLEAVAVLQPDVCHVGGPTALKKIAAMAESHRVALAPHNPLGPIATVVNQHLGFSTSNFLIQEVMRTDVAWRNDVVAGGLPITAGYVELPGGLGWGVEVDEREAAKHPYKPEPQIEEYVEDGSITDW